MKYIVALVGRSKYDAYLPRNLLPILLACDVCHVASRPLFYDEQERVFTCSDCPVPRPS